MLNRFTLAPGSRTGVGMLTTERGINRLRRRYLVPDARVPGVHVRRGGGHWFEEID